MSKFRRIVLCLLLVTTLFMVSCGKANTSSLSEGTTQSSQDKSSQETVSNESQLQEDQSNDSSNSSVDDVISSSSSVNDVTSSSINNTDSSVVVMERNLANMNLIFLGSSVTYGSASNGWSMCEYLSKYHGCNVKKYAVSGTTLASTGNGASYVERLRIKVNKEDPCDYFICQLSTNDSNKLFSEIQLGTVSASKNIRDFDVKTVIGAMEYIIATVKETWNCPIAFYTGTKYKNANYQYMINALFELQKKWDIGIIDLWNDEEMNAVSEEDYAKYMADPVHPTKIGYDEWWGPKFAQYLKRN